MQLRQAMQFRLAVTLLLFSGGATTNAFGQIGIGIGGINVGVGGGGISVGVGGDGGVNVGVGGGGVDVGIGGTNVNIGGQSGSGSSGSGTGGTPAEIELTQDQTLDAVRKKRAVPLAPLVTSIKSSNVEVIDARLLEVRGILVYQIRIIGGGGDVSELYFYARTGRQVTPD